LKEKLPVDEDAWVARPRQWNLSLCSHGEILDDWYSLLF
jgi:hypothetical protein